MKEALGQIAARSVATNGMAARALAEAVAPSATDIFVSPGSRSTPLALAFDALAREREDVSLHVILDERTAAFAALGASRSTRRPAVLVCTSGTAAGHYLPAIMEADQSRVPLIVLTADRPPELHHCGAPQTIPQQRLFTSYVRWSAHLVAPREGQPDRDLRWLRAMGARARVAALGSPAGPVHLNAPFRKPLVDDAPSGAGRGEPIAVLQGERRLSGSAREELARLLASAERGVIHCGPHNPAVVDDEAFAEAVGRLAHRIGWPIIADGVSGVRFGPAAVVSHADALARAGVMPDVDVVLRFGDAPTNKAVTAWIADVPRGVLVDPDGLYRDPSASSTTLVVADPVSLCDELADHAPPLSSPSSWQTRWRELDETAAAALSTELPRACAGIIAVEALARTLPSGARLHVASSMAVRDFDLTARRRSPLRVTSNRGVNGIDGTIATGLGVGLATRTPTAILLGDLAFAHDLGGLAAACRARVPLTLVAVDNAGGGIFEMLPVAGAIDREAFERLFAAPQAQNLGAIAEALGAEHHRVAPDQLHAALPAAYESSGVTVLEIREDRVVEARKREAMWRAVIEGLRSPGRGGER